MPSIFTHSLVGLAAGKILHRRRLPKRFWVLSFLCPSLPDADVISIAFGIPYAHLLGHRGITHSIIFALVVGFLIVWVFFRKENLSLKRAISLAAYFAFITASHGILDGLNNGSLGVAFFAPFDNTRYLFPISPIEVSPIGLAFFGERGLTVIISEMLWVWIPILSILLVKTVLESNVFKKSGDHDSESSE